MRFIQHRHAPGNTTARCLIVIVCIICSLFTVPLSTGAEAELPDPASHLKSYPVLEDYFTLEMFAIYSPEIAEMQQYYGVDAGYLIEQQAKMFALHGINTLISPPPIKETLNACQKYHINYLPERLFWYNSSFEETKKQWKEFVEIYKDAPGVFGWYVFDEPNGSVESLRQYIELKNELYSIDPKHPTVEVTSGVDEKQAQHSEYYMWDHYPYLDSPFTGGSLFSLKDQAQRAGVSSPNINVAVIQMTNHGNWQITPEEIRGQIYTVLANGCNGLGFYSGTVRPPFWTKWSSKETYVSSEGLRTQTAGAVYSNPSPLLVEVKRIAEHLIPAGYLLVNAKYQSEPQKWISVTCPAIASYMTEQDNMGIWRHVEKKIPAIEVGVWKKNDETVFVIHNNDLEKSQKGLVRIKNLPQGAELFDLWTLEPIDLSNSGFFVEFKAAEGQLYYLGTRSQFQIVKQKILKRTYEYQNTIFQIQVKAANQTGLLDLVPVNETLQKSQQSFEKENYRDACTLIQNAQKQFVKISNNSEFYKEISGNLEKSRQLLYDIDEWLIARAPLLCDETFKLDKDVKPDNWRSFFSHLPRLEAILSSVREQGTRFWQIHRLYEKGEGKNIRKELAQMVQELQRSYQALNQYRGEMGPNAKVGFVVLRDPAEKKLVYDRDAWSFIRLTVPHVEMVVVDGKGLFTDESGKPVKLENFNSLWIHYSTPCGIGYLDRTKKIPVPQSLIDTQTIEALKNYLQSGRGMLLSGLAGAYVNKLGIEKVEPNLVDINKKGFITEVFSPASVLYTKLLGLKKVAQAKQHPIFDGIDNDVLLFRGEEPGYRRNRVSWQYPAVPNQGNVLACLETNFGAVPDLWNFDLVEFAVGPGRVIACGSPAWVFDTNMDYRGERFKRFRTLQSLISNIIDYLGKETKPVFVSNKLEGPFCHKDIAKIETNPSLTWKVSSGVNGQAMYSQDHLLHWETEQDNAWTECDFGFPRLINKVCVISAWEMGRWDVAHLRLQVKDEKTGTFIDLDPPAVFDGRLVWETARFSFKPITTSAIRLVDIRRASKQSGIKIKEQVSPPIGIFDIVVYSTK